MNYRENHICLICEKNNTLLPWTICRSCGEFIVLNWNKLNKEEYRVHYVIVNVARWRKKNEKSKESNCKDVNYNAIEHLQ